MNNMTNIRLLDSLSLPFSSPSSHAPSISSLCFQLSSSAGSLFIVPVWLTAAPRPICFPSHFQWKQKNLLPIKIDQLLDIIQVPNLNAWSPPKVSPLLSVHTQPTFQYLPAKQKLVQYWYICPASYAPQILPMVSLGHLDAWIVV